ncbi:8062_t:CDS:1, partial [Gigaspora margarita]
MSQSTNQTFGVQQQSINRQLLRPQNTGNLQRALNTGRQAPRPQNTPNLLIDTYISEQRYNDLVGGSTPFARTQSIEISPEGTQISMHLFLG